MATDITSIRLRFSWAEVIVKSDGRVELEMRGYTVGERHHKIVFELNGVGTLGYIAEASYKALATQQAELDAVRKKLKGE
jgi:hypothetical protein